MIRLFTALSLPETVRTSVLRLQGGVRGARWQTDDQLHVTLRFIGDVDEAVFSDVDLALGAIQFGAFSVSLKGVGMFGDKRPRTLWAGVNACEPLLRLESKVEMALQRVGLEAETRKYTPHVTVARLKEAPRAKVAEFLAIHSPFETAPFPMKAFHLYSSQLGQSGARYRIERTYALNQPNELCDHA
jgi:2'-5' RNA ligase